MAITTKYTYLMYKKSGESLYEKLVDIKDFSDLGGAPNMLESTTLSDDAQTFVPGIVQMGDGLTFTANYDVASYKKLKDLEDQDLPFAVWFGASGSGSSATPDGHLGKFTFTGKLTVTVSGGGVDEIVNMTISIANSSIVSLDQTAGS